MKKYQLLFSQTLFLFEGICGRTVGFVIGIQIQGAGKPGKLRKDAGKLRYLSVQILRIPQLHHHIADMEPDLPGSCHGAVIIHLVHLHLMDRQHLGQI